MGGDVNYSGELQNALIFQSTPPVWAETVSALGSAGSCIHFNPLRPCGRRHQRAAACLGCWNFNPLRPCGRRPKGYSYVEKRAEIFQSTPPVWAETLQTGSTIYWPGFQSTPPVWAETTAADNMADVVAISIHSARVGGDVFRLCNGLDCQISIHSARVGGDSKRNHFFVS